MTHESSNDSPRHEPGLSPRRAARAAREIAERERAAAQALAAGDPSPDPAAATAHGGIPADAASMPNSPPAPATAGAAASEESARAAAAELLKEEHARTVASERAKALDAAQRARTQSALRARQEAIEAQRAAAERVRQTLRSNAAPLRDRSAAARSAITPDSSATRVRELYSPGPQGPPASPPGPPASADPEPHAAPEQPPEAASGPEHPQHPDREPFREAPTALHGASAVAHELEHHDDDPQGADPQGADSHGADPRFAGYRDAERNGVGQQESGHLPADHYDGAAGYPVEADEALERENLFLTTMAADPKARKTRRRRRNWVVLAVLLGFCAVIFGVVLFLQGLMERLNPQDFPPPGGAAVSFEVKSGWGPKQIGRELENRDIVASDKLFLEAIQLVDAENREIHPGTYDLRQQMPALDAASILIGEPASKVSYVAIKQNTRINAVLEEISKSTGLPLEELQALSKDPGAFGIKSGATNLEGYLHPGEYRFPLETDAKTVLKTMVDATTKTLTANGVTDPKQQYHVLNVASILQAEARKDDYATVAGALENRLHPNNTETNGLLQVDSAVIYGLDRYTLQISGEEKVDASNPYNTYEHKGLPPTPIGSPGDPAIKAAADPTPNDYYYWVTVNTNTGETKFARTYAEHRVYQNEFRSWCAANTDVCK